MNRTAERTQALKPSATLAISAKAKALKAAGENIINLSAGEPDFDTPDFIKKAAITAIKNGETRYTAVDGIPSLKEAIIEKFARDNQLTYSADQIIVSTGAKQALYNLFMAILNKGDEVLIPCPYWVSYPDMAVLAEATPVKLPTTKEQSYKLTAEQLSAAITEKTKLLIINSPSNPSGGVYTRAELEALAEVLKQHPQVFVISDDIYEHVYWGKEPFCNILMACPELADRTTILNGMSKAYAMTGWRLGYAAGPKDIIAVMKKIQSQSTSNPCSITQAAGEAALRGDQSCITRMVVEFKERYQYIHQALNNIDGVEAASCSGAFYILPNMQAVIDRMEHIENDVELAAYLLDEAKVATVPGSAFGQPGYLRLSYALDMDSLKQAISRIEQAISA